MDVAQWTKCLIRDPTLLTSYIQFVDLLEVPTHFRVDLILQSQQSINSYDNIRNALDVWKSCTKSASVEALKTILWNGGYKLAAGITQIMVVYERKKTIKYKKLFCAESLNHVCCNSTTKTVCIGFPASRPRRICGRSEELKLLMDYLTKERATIVLVAAVGGQGKTTLAMAFVNRLEAVGENAVVTWLNGSGIVPLTSSILDLCTYFKCPKEDDKGKPVPLVVAMNDVGSVIREKNRKESQPLRWVVILDNVDTVFEELHGVINSIVASNALLLVTSRRANIVQYECEVLRLGPLDMEAAKCLVAGYLPSISAQDIETLCEKLDCYALGLRQSAAYIRHQQQHSLLGDMYGIGKYISNLEVNILQPGPVLLDYNHTTEAIIRIAVTRIEALEAGRICIFLLHVLSIVSTEGVHVNYLEELALKCLQDVCSSRLVRALEDPKAFALINCKNQVVTIHRIIQLVVKQLMKYDGHLLPLLNCLLPTYKLEVHHTLANVHHFVKIYEETYEYEDLRETFGFLYIRIYNTLVQRRLYAQRLSFMRKCWSTFKSVYGSLHKQTLRANKLYIIALTTIGRYQDAMLGMKECYENHLRSPFYGPQSEMTFDCLQEIGTLSRIQGNLEKSREALQQALEKLFELKGNSHPYTFRARKQLALTDLHSGHHTEALNNLRHLLYEQQQIYESTDRRLLTARYDIAVALYNAKDYASAKEELQLIFNSSEEAEDNITTMQTQKLLACCLHAMGQKEQAYDLLTKLLLPFTRRLGSTHPLTPSIKNTMVCWGRVVLDDESK